jgi:hypothetical protein
MEQSVAHAQEKIVKLEAEIARLRAELKALTTPGPNHNWEEGFNDEFRKD